ncbi:MAG: calcium-binding protein [Acetobacteraceae bacterium]|nr:calcium-binding protein [Acetobacteraceae bacterium]
MPQHGAGRQPSSLALEFRAGGEAYRLALGLDDSDSIAGTSARDHVWGSGGADAIGGGPGADVLVGGAGRDLLSGNDGMDLLRGGNGADTLFGGADADMLFGGAGNDYLDEGAGHSGLEGGPGDDTLVGGQGPDAFVVDRMSGDDIILDFTAGPGMFDHIALRDLRWGDLAIEDTASGARISWDGGSVLLVGVAKAELAQDDFMFADSPDLPPASREPGGPAGERESPSDPGPEIAGADGSLPVRPGMNGLALPVDGGSAVVGGNGGDELAGGTGDDHLFGRNGADRLLGAAGNDVLQGDNGRDTLEGGAGMDRLDGGRGADSLIGGDDADELMGGDGRDVLDEGAGHGMLDGGRGDDTLTGGEGADAFIVAPDSGNDVVTDFEARGPAQGAFDHIAFRDIAPEDVTVTDTADGALVAWDVDGDGRRDGSVLLLGVARDELRQSDFMFVGAPGFVDGIDDFGSWFIFPGDVSPIA